MSSAIEIDLGHGLRKYRIGLLGQSWQKSSFEYFNESRSEWRAVNNWNSRELLFREFAPLLAIN